MVDLRAWARSSTAASGGCARTEAYVNVGVWNGFSLLRRHGAATRTSSASGSTTSPSSADPSEAFMARLREARARCTASSTWTTRSTSRRSTRRRSASTSTTATTPTSISSGPGVAEPFFSRRLRRHGGRHQLGRAAPGDARLHRPERARVRDSWSTCGRRRLAPDLLERGDGLSGGRAAASSAKSAARSRRTAAADGEGPAEPNPVDYDGRSRS